METPPIATPNRWFGHIRLCLEPENAALSADRVALPAHRLGPVARVWLAEGGDLALRALAPAAALGPNALAKMDLLVRGPGSGIAAFAGVELGFRRVCALPWPGYKAVREVLATHCPQVQWLKNDATVTPSFHRVLESVTSTDVADRFALSGWLLPHGEWVLYGMSAAKLGDAFEAVLNHGFALRAAGIEAERAFLAGSVD